MYDRDRETRYKDFQVSLKFLSKIRLLVPNIPMKNRAIFLY